MPPTDGDRLGTASQHDESIPTIDPEKEPEYVGAHSARTHPECQNWIGETRDEIEQCGEWSTHTVVMTDGKKLHEIAMCNECGEPEDVDASDREWSGEIVGGREYRRGSTRGNGPMRPEDEA